jgi:hypothetical protein
VRRTFQLCARATKVILLFIGFSGRVFLRRIKDLAQVDQFNAIHSQRLTRRSSDRRQTNDPRAVGAPGEMIPPSLLSRVKQTNNSASDRIRRLLLRVLVPIAALAGESQILLRRLPASRVGVDVFYGKPLRREALLAPAVFTDSSGLIANRSAEFSRNMFFRHRLQA